MCVGHVVPPLAVTMQLKRGAHAPSRAVPGALARHESQLTHQMQYWQTKCRRHSLPGEAPGRAREGACAPLSPSMR